jgi:hypothetical protein
VVKTLKKNNVVEQTLCKSLYVVNMVEIQFPHELPIGKTMVAIGERQVATFEHFQVWPSL